MKSYRTLLVSLGCISFCILPSLAQADDGDITSTLNIRYQGSLIWTGTVSLKSASSTALDALKAADEASPDFSITDLQYFPDYNSYYVNCIDVVAVPAHACGNWQYVVNSNYPPVGADKYTLTEGDVLYFYFGSPRRVSLTQSNAEASTSVSVLTQTYDYTNNTWQPLPGILIGATEPNPTDPYSPLVLFSATSDPNGIATLFITTPGTYSIGIANDYYYPAEPLTISPIQAALAEATVETSHRTTTTHSSQNRPLSEPISPPINDAPPTPKIIEPAEETTLLFNISVNDFVKNYTAAVYDVGSTIIDIPHGWLKRFLRYVNG